MYNKPLVQGELIPMEREKHLVQRVRRGITVQVLVIGLSAMPVMLVQGQETVNKPLVLREHIQLQDHRHVRRVKRGIIVQVVEIG